MTAVEYLQARLAVLKRQQHDDLSPIGETHMARVGAIVELEHALVAIVALDAVGVR